MLHDVLMMVLVLHTTEYGYMVYGSHTRSSSGTSTHGYPHYIHSGGYPLVHSVGTFIHRSGDIPGFRRSPDSGYGLLHVWNPVIPGISGYPGISGHDTITHHGAHIRAVDVVPVMTSATCFLCKWYGDGTPSLR